MPESFTYLAKVKSEKEFEKFSNKRRELERAESLKELEDDLKKINHNLCRKNFSTKTGCKTNNIRL